MTAQTRSEIAELLQRHGLAPRHHLGQHFLADANITRKIVSMARVRPGDRIIEVGAGTGTLTRALATAGAHVVAYEVDRGLRPVLEEQTEDMDVDLRFEDVMSVDFAVFPADGESWKLVANLPYNVGTPFLLDAIQKSPAIELFVVMVQREVAERLCAGPGSRDYGLPSVISQIFTTPHLEFTVPPQVFYPRPRVESAVVVMERIESPPHAERAVEIAAEAFRQRRKMVRGSLKGTFAEPLDVLQRAGIDPKSRAEELSPSDYLTLAELS